MAQFETKYGFFNDEGTEYVIRTYDTPKPWINVISNGNYGLVISQTGGGFSFLEHSEFNRLNRWHQDLIKDDWGKYFYIKNNDTDEVWSPLWMPVKTEFENYECTYGLGYARFRSIYKDIETELTVFVPQNENTEIWSFVFRNNRRTPVSLSIYSYFEFCLGSSSDFHREFHKTFIETEFDEKNGILFGRKRLWEIPLGDRGHWNIDYPYLGYITSNRPVTDFDADKESFIGQYGSLQSPAGISNNSLARKSGKWNDSIGCIRIKVTLKEFGTSDAAFFMGIAENKKEVTSIIKKYSKISSISKEIENVRNMWSTMLGTLHINTPDTAMNIMVNYWLRYQAIVGRLWARTAYYQQSGAFGFRDQLQDSLVYLTIKPDLTLKQISLHARHQFKDGTVLHWWHPISETGLTTKMTDDLLWLPFVVLNYIEETADYPILNIKEPYYDDPKKKGTIFEHCEAAIQKVLSRMSKRGLPLIGAGDWNDGLSAVGLEMKGESIWLTEFLYFILIRFSGLCFETGRKKSGKRYSDAAGKLKKSFDKNAWDGNWFIRATKDNGEKIGSRENKEGRIYLNAQTWSVISDIADKEKQNIAMDSVKNNLFGKNGTLLLYPAYVTPDKMVGYLSRYAPGRRENGGVYTHAATWSIWAYSILKENELTYELFKRLCPVYNSINSDEYKAEPYVLPGNIDGPDSPDYGMGGWTWYTGSASWFQKVIVDNILGIRAVKKGLLIDPCIPDEWKSYEVQRKFRGSNYYIVVSRRIEDEKPGILVNGKIISGNVITPVKGNKINIRVII